MSGVEYGRRDSSDWFPAFAGMVKREKVKNYRGLF